MKIINLVDLFEIVSVFYLEFWSNSVNTPSIFGPYRGT